MPGTHHRQIVEEADNDDRKLARTAGCGVHEQEDAGQVAQAPHIDGRSLLEPEHVLWSEGTYAVVDDGTELFSSKGVRRSGVQVAQALLLLAVLPRVALV